MRSIGDKEFGPKWSLDRSDRANLLAGARWSAGAAMIALLFVALSGAVLAFRPEQRMVLAALFGSSVVAGMSLLATLLYGVKSRFAARSLSSAADHASREESGADFEARGVRLRLHGCTEIAMGATVCLLEVSGAWHPNLPLSSGWLNHIAFSPDERFVVVARAEKSDGRVLFTAYTLDLVERTVDEQQYGGGTGSLRWMGDRFAFSSRRLI